MSGSKKLKVKVKAYPVIRRAVEEGCLYGVGRLWKYRDTLEQGDAQIYADEIEDAVMIELCKVIDFDRGDAE